MADEKILNEEEESSIIMLTDENGNDVEFEYLDCIDYEEMHLSKPYRGWPFLYDLVG